MTDEPRQRLSALQDSELDAAQVSPLLDAMADDSELRACWERYTLIGLALRGEAIDPHARDLADRVRTALATEPTILCPKRLERARPPARRLYAGFALAASVTLVAVLAAPVFMSEPIVPAAVGPVAVRLVEHQTIPLQRWHQERPELASKLDRYLVTHHATAPSNGAKGLLPYAMLVGYESDR